jgi:hypothetical protein
MKAVRMGFLFVLILMALMGCDRPDRQEGSVKESTSGVMQTQSEMQYYQQQLSALQEQIDNMDAKMASLKDAYLQKMADLQDGLDLIIKSTEPIGRAPVDHEAQTEDAREENSTFQEEIQSATDKGLTGEKPEEELKSSAHYTYREESGGVIIVRYVGAERAVTIPAGINGKPVTGIDQNAFAHTEVCSVVVPESVSTLGWFTFFGCSSLRSVTLPASIQTIGYASFDGCHKDLTLHVTENSYAQKFAASFALRYELAK